KVVFAIQPDRNDHAGGEASLPESRFLFGFRVLPDGASDFVRYPALRLQPDLGMERPCHGAARSQPPDPPPMQIHRPERADLSSDRKEIERVKAPEALPGAFGRGRPALPPLRSLPRSFLSGTGWSQPF